MTGRHRGWVIALGLIVVLIGAEVSYNLWLGSRACVEVTNQGREPIENLVLTLGSSRTVGGRLLPGEKVALYLNGRAAGTLTMSFSQKGSAIGNFQVPGFDPVALNAEAFKLVLNVRPNEVEKYQDDADPATPLGRLIKAAWQRLETSLGVTSE